jgi:hypothetical protein
MRPNVSSEPDGIKLDSRKLSNGASTHTNQKVKTILNTEKSSQIEGTLFNQIKETIKTFNDYSENETKFNKILKEVYISLVMVEYISNTDLINKLEDDIKKLGELGIDTSGNKEKKYLSLIKGFIQKNYPYRKITTDRDAREILKKEDLSQTESILFDKIKKTIEGFNDYSKDETKFNKMLEEVYISILITKFISEFISESINAFNSISNNKLNSKIYSKLYSKLNIDPINILKNDIEKLEELGAGVSTPKKEKYFFTIIKDFIKANNPYIPKN